MPPSSRAVKVEISQELDRWIRGFDDLPRAVQAEGRGAWRQATEIMFLESQRFVHVDTGQLKASGERQVIDEGDALVAEILYDTPYAIYEHARGGSHSWLTRAYESSGRIFEKALRNAFEDTVQAWK